MKFITGLFSAIMSFQTMAQNETIKDTMIVFDASGSMWGQIDGVNKITTAKLAIESISQGFSEDQAIGLLAYGHRQKYPHC